MRRLLVLALAAGLVLLFLWPERPPASALHDAGASDPVPAVAPSPSPALAAPPSSSSPGTGEPDPQEARTAAEGIAAAPLDDLSGTPRARVFGRIVDSHNQPVEGFVLELTSSGDEWRPGVTVPILTRGRWTTPVWRTETDADGRFLFDVPVPTAEWVELIGESDPYFSIVVRYFDAHVDGGHELPFLEGDNDLGTLVSLRTGALTGHVIDAGGAPLVGARVRVIGPHPGPHVVSTETGEDGRYVLEHVPPASVTLEVKKEGFIDAESAEPVEARVGITLPGPTLQLERAPTISGIVVDEDGAPLSRVRVQGYPVGGGWDASAKTNTDGRFLLYLSQLAPYQLEIDDDPQFEPWGRRGKREVFEPGTDGVRITLKRLPRMTVAVVDAATGDPVELFELRADRDKKRLGTRPGGRVEVCAELEEAATLLVDAPGYVPVELPILFDVPDVPLQTVRVEPGARIRARVLFDGAALAAARVELKPAMMPNILGAAIDPNDDMGDTWHFDVEGEAARERMTMTDGEGRFEFFGLAPGTYAISIRHDRIAFHRVEATVKSRATIDLGDVEVEKAASLRVTLRLAGSESPIGIRYEVEGRFDTSEPILRADGVFELTGLAAGKCEIRLRADGQRILVDTLRSFDLDAGETRDVLIDLSNEVPSEVTVRVTANGEPVAGAGVVLGGDADRYWHLRFGETDASGIVRNLAPAPSTARVSVHVNGLCFIRPAPIELISGEPARVDLDVTVGTLVLQFSSDFVLPELAAFDLFLEQLDASESREVPGRGRLTAKTPRTSDVYGIPWQSPRVELERVAIGRYRLKLDTWRWDDEGSSRVQLLPALTREIEVRRGEVTVIDVPGH